MTDSPSSKLHYLFQTPPHEKTGEDNMPAILTRLESLEKESKKHFSKMEKILSDPSQKKGKLEAEIEVLRKDLQTQVQQIRHQLQSFHGTTRPQKSSLDWLKRFYDWIFFKIEHNPIESIWQEDIDSFGRDPAFEEKLKPFFDFLYYRYWRTRTYGLENIPSEGRALLVSNHSGTLPYDGSMIRLAVSNDHPSKRDVRFLVEDFVYYLPFLGTYMYRVGGVRASRENAERLLNNNHLVVVFPEGVKGIGKYYTKRYHLQRFGRGGFVKIAIQTKSPIIPVAVIGAEEIHPILYKSSLLAKPLGIPYLPVTPTLPWLGPLGLIPLPSKWRIYFGEPIDLSHYDSSVLDDELEIHRISERVRQKIQIMITDGLKQRSSVWW